MTFIYIGMGIVYFFQWNIFRQGEISCFTVYDRTPDNPAIELLQENGCSRISEFNMTV